MRSDVPQLKSFFPFLATVLLIQGCATKRYVGQQISPVEQRVAQLERQAAEQGKSLDAAENDISKTRERMVDLAASLKLTAENTEATANTARQALTSSQQAITSSQQANAAAADARKHTDQRASQLEQFVESRGRLKLVRTEQILFGIGKSVLSEEAKQTLDAVAQQALAMDRYVLEIQGFADNTGSNAGNIALSEQRAQSVVRHLNQTHSIPLRAVHLLGSGSASPVAPNETAAGRRQNRRVEIRLFAPEANSVSSAQLR
jgi:outer membrane protein OmpA-like peptidoglycan-associated protein